jgi:hypothetical protein
MEIPPEPPILPEGESHSLPASFFADTATPPPINYETPHPAYMQLIDTVYKKDKGLILHWWPLIYGKPSEFVTDKPIACHPSHVLAHAKGMKAQGYMAPVPLNPVVNLDPFAEAHSVWMRECNLRKKWVEEKKEVWKRRRQERADWLESMRLIEKQWDIYVEEARKEFKDAEAYPVPIRPVK